ncbi:MAG: FAD:protein FMN transferase [Spirochaetaceae bacterium]|nr:MAG: FAD:protein FMN transferase [Spirochaetaceae bacterium]
MLYTRMGNRSFHATGPSVSTVLAVTALILAPIVITLGCSREPSRESRSASLLGTVVTITVYDAPRNVFDAVFDRVREIEARMSINESNYDDTEILRVNRAAGKHPVPVSDDTFQVIETAIEYGVITGGAFDVSIAPLILLWGIGTPRERLPAPDEVTSARSLVDFSRIVLDSDARTVFLPEPGMGIDVGGIAKGYAVDEATRILSEAGVERGIVDFGGDIMTIGRRPDGRPWRVGVRNPEGTARGNILGVIESTGETIVSSGPYERYFVKDGVQYHHIFDPETGYPTENNLTSVTVVSAVSETADALSTAAFVLGLEDGYRLIEQLPGTEGVFVTDGNRVYTTPGLRARFEITHDEFRDASREFD